MKFRIMVTACIFSIAVVSCSDEQKDEAAKLGEELENLDQAVDSSQAAVVEDSLGDTAGVDTTEIDEVLEESAEAMPPAPTGDGYTVQVASCESADYARYLIGLYSERGYEAFVSKTLVNDQTYYRVRIGNYASVSEANNLQAELKDKYSIEPWIDVLGN